MRMDETGVSGRNGNQPCICAVIAGFKNKEPTLGA